MVSACLRRRVGCGWSVARSSGTGSESVSVAARRAAGSRNSRASCRPPARSAAARSCAAARRAARRSPRSPWSTARSAARRYVRMSCSGRKSGGHLDVETMALGERRDRREVDLELVARRDLLHAFLVSRGEHRCELAEVLREGAGRDDLEEAQRLVTRVPERVLLSAWFVHELTGPCLDHVVPELRSQPSFQDVRVLVFVRVPV